VTTAARCHQCGEPVGDGALFCGSCGVEVSGEQGPDATVAMTSEGSEKIRAHASMRESLRRATLGEYEILAELGRGGMATVFLAHDIALDRKVAIKVISPHLLQGEGMVERFKLEARTAGQLSHPHIIPIYAVKETDETLCFVMKFIEGRPLDQIIRKLGPLPIPMAKDILIKVGQALGYAHRREVVHRDVKPGNIMIDEEGTAVVTDFGIAKVAQADGLTMTGAAMGTPAYMSPEQCSGGTITGAADQYSLGIVAFHMLTGKVPYTADSAMGVMYKHCHEPLPPMEDFRPDCPPDLRDTVLRMVAKDPEQRWPTLEAVVQRLGSDGMLQYDDPIRTQMIDVVREGGHREILAGIHTPRSPVPLTRRSTRGGTVDSQPGIPAPTRSRWVWPLGAALAVGLIGAAVVLRPWPQPAELPGDDPSPPAEEVAAEPPAPVPDEAEVGTTDSPPPDDIGAPVEPPPAPARARAEPDPAPVTASVATLRMGAPPDLLEPGDAGRLSATPLDARGAALGGRTVTWRSEDPGVLSIGADGAYTALQPGQATVVATSEGVRGTATLLVRPAAVARVRIQDSPGSLAVGESARLLAEPLDRGGDLLPDRPVEWASSDEGIAGVSAEGVVTARAPGSATITARAGAASGTVRLSVRMDTRSALADVVARYARALESRDIEAVRSVYPGISSDQERQLRQALEIMTDLQAELRIVGNPQVSGDQATAEVAGTYVYYNASLRRQERAPVTFTAIFRRDGESWRLVQTR
jgi:eukaryotic-like serine/threonine-protein kinase